MGSAGKYRLTGSPTRLGVLGRSIVAAAVATVLGVEMSIFSHRRIVALVTASLSLVTLALTAAPAWAGNITESSGNFNRTAVSSSTLALILVVAATLAVVLTASILGLRARSRRASRLSGTAEVVALPTANVHSDYDDRRKAA